MHVNAPFGFDQYCGNLGKNRVKHIEKMEKGRKWSKSTGQLYN